MIKRLAVILALFAAPLAVCPQAFAQPFIPTVTTGASSISPSQFGQPITFSATVNPSDTTGSPPTGTVTFKNQQTVLGVANLAPNLTATLPPLTLPAGKYNITVTYSGDASYIGSSGSIVQVVFLAPTFVTWNPNPASIAVGAPLTPAQLDATAASKYVPSVPGTFVYSPPAGSVFATPGPQTLNVTFTPTDTANFLAARGSAQITVVPLSLTNITPNNATLGAGPTTITFTGTGFHAGLVAQVNGTAIPTTFVNATTLTGIIPATAFIIVSTLQLAVSDPQIQLTTKAFPLTVTAPTPQIVLTGPGTSPSGTQPTLNFQLTNPYPVTLNGVFTLTFTPAPNLPDDPMIRFPNGLRTLPVSIPANSTATPAVQLQAGTIAGTITITLTLNAGGVDVTPETLQPVVIQVPAAPPGISTVSLQRSGTQLTVVVHGFSNTREVSTANFHFTGSSISDPDIPVPVTQIFAQWFASDQSFQFGSAFTYTQIFTLTRDSSSIKSVSVTLVNSIGTSSPGSAQ